MEVDAGEDPGVEREREEAWIDRAPERNAGDVAYSLRR